MAHTQQAALPRPTTGALRPYINRFSHLTVNVSDLERSREFWESVFPARVVARTGGTEQAFPSLGVERGSFIGYMLQDPAPYPGRGIHLVQWLDPKPLGHPYDNGFTPGWYRACAVSGDVRARYEQALAAGGRPFAEPRPPRRIGGSDPSRVTFAFTDPDGVVLEWVTNAPRLGAADESTYHAAAHCTDLRRSFAFYTEVVGLDLMLRTRPPESYPASSLPAFGPAYDGDVLYDAVFLCHRADQRNPIDLLQWVEPKPAGAPYASPFNLGIQRLAFEVDDIDAAYAALIGAPGVDDSMVSGPPEPWDLGELGVRRVVLFTDPDGLGLELIERPPYFAEADPSRDDYPPLATA